MKRLFIALVFFLFPSSLLADISSPFSADFDSFSEGTVLSNPQFYPFSTGLAADGCANTTITSSAGMGGSGRGIRYLAGNGKNKNSGSFVINLATATNEIWVRFYKRYASGFTWQGGGPSEEKVLWFSNQSNTDAIIYEHSRNQCWEGSNATNDAVYWWLQNSSVNENVCGSSNTGWVATQGGATGDGQWHAHEVHVKKSSSATSTDGVLQVWIDGVLRMNRTNVATGNGWPRDQLHFQVNQDSAGNIPCAAVDFDNLAIYTSTPPNVDAGGRPFIGLLGTSTADTTPPVLSSGSPSGTLSAGTTSTTMSVATSEAATCKYSDTAGTAYASMAGTFTTTGGTNHSVAVTGITDGNSLTKYVRCIDSSGNANASDYAISWSVAASGGGTVVPGNLLFHEGFEAAINNSGGWGDGSLMEIASGGVVGNAAKLTWAAGATTPTNISTIRRDLGAGHDSIYVEFWVKFSSGWRGSGQNYHPHLMWIRGSDDYAAGIWDGPAYAYQNHYFEFSSATTSPYGIRPVLMVQDGKRVNLNYGTPPLDISAITESRSVGSCNGIKAGAYQGTFNDCYNISGSSWWSQLGWRGTNTVPFDSWTKVAYAIRLNTVSSGIGNADGEWRVWINGTEVMHQTNVIMRPGSDAGDALRQFALAPYIGDGAPVTETMWIDELSVYDGYQLATTASSAVSLGTILLSR